MEHDRSSQRLDRWSCTNRWTSAIRRPFRSLCASAFWAAACFLPLGCGDPQRTNVDPSAIHNQPNAGQGPGVATAPAESYEARQAAPVVVSDPAVDPDPGLQGQPDATTAEQMLAERARLDARVWSVERQAQRHEEPFIRLWDSLRAAEDAYPVLRELEFQSLSYRAPRLRDSLELGMRILELDGEERRLSSAGWLELLSSLQRDGYQLLQSEWHHSRFEPARGDRGAKSNVSFVLDIVRDEPIQRLSLRGDLEITWRKESASPVARRADELPRIDSVSLRSATLSLRDAGPAFQEILRVATDRASRRIMPLLVYDLDGDGLSEIVLGGLNRIYWNRGRGEFRMEPLSSHPLDIFDAAVLADFSGDGHVDLLCVGRERVPLLLEGNAQGRFPLPPRRCADVELELPKAFTAGDVDGDGDLDAWIGQYKFPYVEGAMPTPFYDANDGHPSVLLVNQGDGRFVDRTDVAGLAAKRNRRTFSSSLVDLDRDGDLDLMTVNDFCGVDVYANEGHGTFTDVTNAWVDQRHLFGMGHAFGDFNVDGYPDIYLIGMSSTTARRLDQMNAGRDEHPDINRMRSVMGYGNRMLLFDADADRARYRQAPFNDLVARTGWSWGVTAMDVENDGDQDLYIANGHDSGKSARDYCTRYWCHDVYTGSSRSDEELGKLFGLSLRELHQGDISWNGFEHNVLWLNEGGRAFHQAGHLLGVAFEFDGRAVVSDDLDGDGYLDLLVVRYESDRIDESRYEVRVLRNTLERTHHWLGVRLGDAVCGKSPLGAEVEVVRNEGPPLRRWIVTGDSFSSQHAATAHFGLGSDSSVRRIQVRWPDGSQWSLDAPAVDRYHDAKP